MALVMPGSTPSSGSDVPLEMGSKVRLTLPRCIRELNLHMTLRCVVRLTVHIQATQRQRDLVDAISQTGNYEQENS